MATTTQLTNPIVTIATLDFSDQCTSATITVGYDSLETTAFGSNGRTYTKGLEAVEVTLTMFLSYGTSEVESTLFGELGDGTTTIKIKAATGAEGASNPEYTITNAMLASFTPINGGVGELGTVDVTFTGGTFARDITPPAP
jgi:hypothetical protein